MHELDCFRVFGFHVAHLLAINSEGDVLWGPFEFIGVPIVVDVYVLDIFLSVHLFVTIAIDGVKRDLLLRGRGDVDIDLVPSVVIEPRAVPESVERGNCTLLIRCFHMSLKLSIGEFLEGGNCTTLVRGFCDGSDSHH